MLDLLKHSSVIYTRTHRQGKSKGIVIYWTHLYLTICIVENRSFNTFKQMFHLQDKNCLIILSDINIIISPMAHHQQFLKLSLKSFNRFC